ncbi:unnamed protein product [Ascophyllum nodosum]
MPNNKKKKAGSKASKASKAKGGSNRSNAANKDDLTGLDEILSNPEEMAAARQQAAEKGTGYKPKTGQENAKIGLKGFAQAAQNPEMLTEAMSMLRDPETIKAAEEMMQDPEFKSEISQYIETIKNNSAFQAAMGEARRKYQALLKDPEKMKEATDKYHATIKAQQEGAAAVAAPGEATSKAGATGTAGTDGGDVLRDGGKEAVAAKAENEIGVGDDGEPLGPEADGLEEDEDEDEEGESAESGAGAIKAPEVVPASGDVPAQVEEAKAAEGESAPAV